MYYPNGREIRANDCVWWNGGTGVGYIRDVLQSKNEMHSFGVEEPSLVISICPRFDCGAPCVVYPDWSIDDEGIGPLTLDEIQTVDIIQSLVAKHIGVDKLICAGTGCKYTNYAIAHWFVVDYASSALGYYIVPPTLDGVWKDDSDRNDLLYRPTV